MVTVLGQKITTTLAIFMDVLKGNPNLVFRKKSVCLKFCIPDLLLLLAQLGKRTPPWRGPAGWERSSVRSARLVLYSYLAQFDNIITTIILGTLWYWWLISPELKIFQGCRRLWKSPRGDKEGWSWDQVTSHKETSEKWKKEMYFSLSFNKYNH